MKAFVLIGGKATRLRPLTLNTPKALIPVLNIPFLEWVIQNLASQQVTDIVLALGHLADQIESAIGDGSRLGVNLYYSKEDKPLGSAGAAKLAEKYLDETFLVFNGDNFIDLDIAAMTARHRENRAKVTIALTRVDDPTSYGLVELEAGGRVKRFLEKPKPEEVPAGTDTVNAGAWLVEPEVMRMVPPETPYSFERDIFPELLSRGETVWSHVADGYWMDAGTPEKYLQLHRDLLNNSSRQYSPENGAVTGENTEIHPTARIEGQVIIGNGCRIGPGTRISGPAAIGPGCAIGENCVIEDSVLWGDTTLKRNVRLKGSIIGNECILGDASGGDGLVLAERVTVNNNVTVRAGSRVEPGENVSR